MVRKIYTWDHWRNHLSLDVEIRGGSQEHVLELFQVSGAGPARHLDFRIWFNGPAAYDFGLDPKQLFELPQRAEGRGRRKGGVVGVVGVSMVA